MKQIVVVVFLTIHFSGFSTTISPPSNLAEMGKMSEVVVFAKCTRAYATEDLNETRFRFKFSAQSLVFGEIEQEFEIQNMHIITAMAERVIIGDNEFEEGKSYLLFLNHQSDNLWKPILFSYGIFVEHFIGGESHLLPLEDHGAHLINKDRVEPLRIYEKDKLLDLLTKAIEGKIPWDHRLAKSAYKINQFKPVLRAAPSHCTFVSDGSNPAHWSGFPGSVLPIKYHNNGDPGCSNGNQKIQDAINTMNSTYQGLNLELNGTHTYTPPGGCTNATGNDYTEYIYETYSTSRYALIQFDDPCNEMAPMSGCNGVQAYGGLWWYSSTHTENGNTWRNAAYAYVVTNQNFGNCNCADSDYENIMIHELSHSLGIGHIAGSGTANMNPSNAGPPSGLDIQCLDYAYPPSSSNCQDIETLANTTISSNITIKASNQIILNNVDITNNATLTLIAPIIDLAEDVNSFISSTLITINEDQCN